MTAVEWLIQQLVELDKQLDGRRKNYDATVIKLNPTKIYEQALEMEKEQKKQQIMDAWDRGLYIGQIFPQGNIENIYEQDSEQYYKETYNPNKP
jgi:hypothetical protein